MAVSRKNPGTRLPKPSAWMSASSIAFASGHADSVVRKAAERAHPLGWLDKPYSGNDLVRAARGAVTELDRKPAGDEASSRSASLH